MKHPDFNIALIFSCVMIGTSNLFLYCYYGKLVTDSYFQFADCLFESDWYLLPTKSQKYFIMMIGNAHRPLCYYGFGVLSLNLETFTKVNFNVFQLKVVEF